MATFAPAWAETVDPAALAGTWICDSRTDRSSGSTEIQYRADGSYEQAFENYQTSGDRKVSILGAARGTWQVIDGVMHDHTLGADLLALEIDGVQVAEDIRQDIEARLRADKVGKTELGDILHVSATTYSQQFRPGSSIWDCRRKGVAVSS